MVTPPASVETVVVVEVVADRSAPVNQGLSVNRTGRWSSREPVALGNGTQPGAAANTANAADATDAARSPWSANATNATGSADASRSCSRASNATNAAGPTNATGPPWAANATGAANTAGPSRAAADHRAWP